MTKHKDLATATTLLRQDLEEYDRLREQFYVRAVGLICDVIAESPERHDAETTLGDWVRWVRFSMSHNLPGVVFVDRVVFIGGTRSYDVEREIRDLGTGNALRIAAEALFHGLPDEMRTVQVLLVDLNDRTAQAVRG